MMDLEALRATYAEWEITAIWIGANSGPDYRKLFAELGDLTVSAHNEAELEAKMLRAEQDLTGAS